jgi:hypothetical protein
MCTTIDSNWLSLNKGRTNLLLRFIFDQNVVFVWIVSRERDVRCSKTTNLSQLWYAYVKQTTHPLTHAVLNSYLQFIIILLFFDKNHYITQIHQTRLQTATNNDVKFNTTTFEKKR